MSLMVNGLMIKLVVLEFISILMALDMRVNGRKIYKKDLELKNGMMGQDLKDNIKKGKKMEKV